MKRKEIIDRGTYHGKMRYDFALAPKTTAAIIRIETRFYDASHNLHCRLLRVSERNFAKPMTPGRVYSNGSHRNSVVATYRILEVRNRLAILARPILCLNGEREDDPGRWITIHDLKGAIL